MVDKEDSGEKPKKERVKKKDDEEKPKKKIVKPKKEKEDKEKKVKVKPEVKKPAVKKPKPKKVKAKKEKACEENEIVVAAAYKKKAIPEHIRTLVWNLWIGEEIAKAKCMCCKATEIHVRHFQAGHVVAEANGGSSEICNLRPICQPCNLAMGTRNMEEFIATFGLHSGGK